MLSKSVSQVGKLWTCCMLNETFVKQIEKEKKKLIVYWLRLVRLITLTLDESRNISGIGTGARVVLRSAISLRFRIPISNPELDTICCNELNWRWAILSISHDVPAPTGGKLDVLVANIWRNKCEVRTYFYPEEWNDFLIWCSLTSLLKKLSTSISSLGVTAASFMDRNCHDNELSNIESQ